jgi:hypothetical protein
MDAEKLIRNIVYRHCQNSIYGIREALNDGPFSTCKYLELDALSENMDTATLKSALASDKFMEQLKLDVKQATGFFCACELALFTYMYEPLYQQEFGKSLPPDLQDAMTSLRITFSKHLPIDVVLDIFRPCVFISCVALALWAVTHMSNGIHVVNVLNAILAHDLLRVSANCYPKMYRVKAARLILQGSSLDAGETASTFVSVSNPAPLPPPRRYTKSLVEKYLDSPQPEILLSGTISGYAWAWFGQRAKVQSGKNKKLD